MKAIQLVETRKGLEPFETHPRFDVLLHSQKVGQLYFNMTGYTGAYLPTPSGAGLDVGERSISAYRKAVAQLNREWAEAERANPQDSTR
jgi:hypothetical protein